MKKQPSTPRKAIVEWEDCLVVDSGAWVDKKIGFQWKPFLVETVGFVLYDGPEGIVVTDSWSSGDLMGPRTQIPRGMLRRVSYEGAK